MTQLRHRITALVLTAGFLAVPPARAEDSANEFQKVSLQQIMGENWPQFQRALATLATDPRNDQAFQELSVVVSEAGALNKVVPYLELVLKQRPDDLTMQMIAGRVCKDIVRDPVRAKEHFEAVLKADSSNFFAHYQLGAMLARADVKEFPQALAHYRTAVEKIPPQYADLRARILREMGDVLYNQRETNPQYGAQALAAWDAVTSGSRKYDLQTYEEVAAEFRSRQLWQKEQETLERYFTVLREINDAPDNVTRCRLKTAIAEACEHQEKYAPAVEALTEAASLLDENAPQRRSLENRIRQARQKLGQGSQHEQELRKAISAAPQSIAARQTLARVLVADGRLDDAASVLEEARKLSPRNAPVLSALEAIYRKAGRNEALAGILRTRMQLSAEDYGAALDLADLHVRNGRMADAEKVLADLEASPSQLSEKYLLLARTCARYGLPKRALLLYKKVIDSGDADNDNRLELCDFCLAHKDFADEALAQVAALSDSSLLDAAGYVRLAEVLRKHERNDLALAVLGRGLSRRGKTPDGRDDRPAIFTLNLALSDLEHRLGEGHRSQAIASTLQALLSAGDLYFKMILNDRLATLLTNYGHRTKLLYSPQEEKTEATHLGGLHGEGIAPWIDFLTTQANSREDPDLWMLLGQVHEAVDVDTEMPLSATTRPATAAAPATRHIKTSLAQALLCYQKVADMEFQNVDAHLALSRMLADPVIDEYERAVNELEVVGLLNPVTRAESMQAMGDLYATAGENVRAKQKWQAVAEQAGGEPSLLHQVAMRMFRGGDLTSAIELAEQARGINPSVFAYRRSCANLLDRLAASDPTPQNLARYVDELGEALTLAQKSPALAEQGYAITQELSRGRLSLAERYLEAADPAAAEAQLRRSIGMLKSSGPSTPFRPGQGDQAEAIAQAEVQLLRCAEAASASDVAISRYEALLNSRPEMLCWLSPGFSVTGQTLLAMKRRGLSLSPRPATADLPAGPVLRVATAGEIDLNDSVRALLAVPPSVFIEGHRQRYRLDVADGKLAARMPRTETLPPGAMSLLPAGNGRAVRLLASDVDAIDQGSGEVIWSRAPGEVKRFGRVLDAKVSGGIVVLLCQKGVQALSAVDGKLLWEQEAALRGFDIGGNTLVFVTAEAGEKYWVARDAQTGRQIARRKLAAATLWQWPLLSGQTLLMCDSLGSVSGFDVSTGARQFELNLDQPLAGRPFVAGDIVLLQTLRDGVVRVNILDLTDMRLRAGLPLAAEGHSIAAISLPPLAWGRWMLYCDAGSSTVLALNTGSGKIARVAPEAAASALASSPTSGIISWTICSDTLLLFGADGHVRTWRLEIVK